MEDLAADLRDYVLGIGDEYKKIVVLGHSMGGMAILALTKHYPDLQNKISRLIIVDIPCNPLADGGSWSQEGELQMLENMSQIDMSQTTPEIFRQIEQYALDKNYADLIKFNVKIGGGNRWRSNIHALVKHYHHMTTYTVTQCNWRAPVELIYGTKSAYFKSNQLQHYAALYPQMDALANFHPIQDAGHWVHFDRKH